ncbi:hypothetical protein [Actinocrispum wychmicini]|uniref:Uncharacterized protein n=1 Tax=Actinocrispum wychmicini TaxID=1213861 RepID=A0A4R2J650_9PSEU|nr:hypothetical protein [Actinocrispum wychmicini]TCO52952.1 hypothetical protein EV192_111146 [Actinocrispum wychmicini]
MNDEITTTVGREFYSFDGRILEIFGGHALRFHIRHLHLRVTGPDRKGKRTVEIAHGRPEVPGTRHIWNYTAAEWEQAQGLVALLEAVQAAIDSTAGHRPV